MARNLIRTQKGITMVELAIILPILFIILFGIFELAIALYDKAVLTNASREGARAGIVSRPPLEKLTEQEIKDVVKKYTDVYLIAFREDKKLKDRDITVTGAGSASLLPLKVEVNYTFDFLVLSRLISALGGHITLNATTVMKME
jgi:Flp pilus assembly protein TadG